MEPKIIYLALIALSALSSVGRADYNLPLFGLLYLTSDKLTGERKWRQQRYFLALSIISILFDLIYLSYWSPLWFSQSWQSWTHWSYRLTAWTISLSVITTLVKIVVVAYLFRAEIMVLFGWKQKVDIIEEYEVYKYLPIPQPK